MKKTAAVGLVCHGRCHISGNRGLNRPTAQRKSDAEHRKQELVQPHSFRADQIRQINAVKKAKDTCDKAGGGENQRAGENRVFSIQGIT